MNQKLDLNPLLKWSETRVPWQRIGKITSSRGMVYEANLPRAMIGSHVEFVTENEEKSLGEVVGLQNGKCLVMPYNDLTGINSQTKIYLKDIVTEIKVTRSMLGRVLDFQGLPIDGKGPLSPDGLETRSIFGLPLNPLDRPPIREPLDVGIKSINSFITAGKGQRLAIMAGSGVGKSVLMGMIAQHTSADINVIALIGERGREVLEFIQSDLGEAGLKRSVVVVATSDSSSLTRTKAAYSSTTIAEYFRDQGADVLLMMDSLTRFAMASREISLSVGEAPGQKGYAPSVFAKLPKIMERAGTKTGAGSITGIYTVLVEGGDMDEPIADAVRSISDGHIVLSRDLAARNHYPAIDVLQSISRVMPKVATREHKIVASHLRDLMAAYKQSEDLINVGAYAKGTNQKVDKAIAIYEDLMNLLKQDYQEKFSINQLFDQMVEIARKAEKSVDPHFEKLAHSS
jgi:flagellum-specific ATP synthase